MDYICYRDYSGKGLGGFVRLVKGDKLQSRGKLLLFDGKPVAANDSQFAYDYLARNDDGKGFKRSRLIRDIRLSAAQKFEQGAFIQAFADKPEIAKFRRQEHPAVWLWNFDFYNADIGDLKSILKQIQEY